MLASGLGDGRVYAGDVGADMATGHHAVVVEVLALDHALVGGHLQGAGLEVVARCEDGSTHFIGDGRAGPACERGDRCEAEG